MVKCTWAEDSPVQIQNPTHCNVIGCSMTAPAACVMAQQYSSATTTVLRTHFRKKKIRRAFQSSCYFARTTMLKTPVSRKSPKSVNSLYFQTTGNLYGTDLPCFKWLFSLTLRSFRCRISWCGGRRRLFGRRCFSVSCSGSFGRRLH